MKKLLIVLVGVLMLFGLSGCDRQEYQLQLGSSVFTSKKTSYKAGEQVEVVYDLIATDTDYYFSADSEDVKLDISYDSRKGFVIRFKMPAHDVKLDVTRKNSMVHLEPKEITIVNQAAEADIWILPDTPENRKTTLWGEAMLKDAAADTEQTIVLEPSEEDEHYLLRMIDTDKMYYEANDVVLEDGQKLVIRMGEGSMEAYAEVYDPDGTLVSTYELFMARL